MKGNALKIKNQIQRQIMIKPSTKPAPVPQAAHLTSWDPTARRAVVVVATVAIIMIMII